MLSLRRQCGWVVWGHWAWNLVMLSSSPSLTTSWICSRVQIVSASTPWLHVNSELVCLSLPAEILNHFICCIVTVLLFVKVGLCQPLAAIYQPKIKHYHCYYYYYHYYFSYNIIYINYVHKSHVFELWIERIFKVYNTFSCINIIHIDLYYHPTSWLMQILHFD